MKPEWERRNVITQPEEQYFLRHIDITVVLNPGGIERIVLTKLVIEAVGMCPFPQNLAELHELERFVEEIIGSCPQAAVNAILVGVMAKHDNFHCRTSWPDVLQYPHSRSGLQTKIQNQHIGQ